MRTHSSNAFSPSFPEKKGEVCRCNGLSRQEYARGDESATDFSYAIALLRRGYPDHDIRQRIFG
ncbi:MAG: hypothetical protein V3U75_03040 [Methylococcaceae bacterium]